MDFPVIIIGGGPVGLTMSLCLSRLGIQSIVIEKHPHTTRHPKARGVNGRSMEIFRQLGLEMQLRQYKLPREAHRFIWFEDFQGEEMTRVESTVDYSQFSPTEPAIIAQDCVEHELFKQAEADPGIDLRFNCQLLDAEQTQDQVTIQIKNKENEQVSSFSAQYLVGADGAYSTIRDLFGIQMEGRDNLGEFCNIYCEMNLDKYISHRQSVGYMFTRRDLSGTFILAKEGFQRWLVGVKLNADEGYSKETFTDDFSINYVKKVINDPSVEVTLINKGFWTMAALIAETYQIGRVFLAGDAAHRLPPTGGFGMNTGIQDAHNLAWKLAYVIEGQASEQLLTTYETERQQIALTNMRWSSKNAQRFETIYSALAMNDIDTFSQALQDQSNHINNISLDLGFIYGQEYTNDHIFTPKAEEGSRAPHCCLQKDNHDLSLLDLFTKQFTLLCSPADGSYWQEMVQQNTQLPVNVITIGEGGDYMDINHDFLDRYKLTDQGAVLIRPDGHIAWRGQDKSTGFDYEI